MVAAYPRPSWTAKYNDPQGKDYSLLLFSSSINIDIYYVWCFSLRLL